MTEGNLGREWLISSYTHEYHPGRSGEDWRREGICWYGWCGVRDLRASCWWTQRQELMQKLCMSSASSFSYPPQDHLPGDWHHSAIPPHRHSHSPAGHLGIQTTISPKLGDTQHLRRESPRFKVPLPRCALVYANLTRTDQHS